MALALPSTQDPLSNIAVTANLFSALEPQPEWSEANVKHGLELVIGALTPHVDSPVVINENLKANILFIIEKALNVIQSTPPTTATGGKGKGHKGKKMGGQDPNVTFAMYNTDSLLTNASPDAQANAIVPASFGPAAFSAGMPMYHTLDSSFPKEYQVAMSGGSRKNRKPLPKPKK